MKQLFYISFILSLVVTGCKKDTGWDSQLENSIVVNAYLLIGEPMNDITISRLQPVDGSNVEADLDLDVRIVNKSKVYHLEEHDKGVYKHPDESILVEANSNYQLEILYGNKVIRSETVTPLAKLGVDISKNLIDTDLNFDQVDVFFTEESDANVFYLVRITPLEEELIPLTPSNENNRNTKEIFVSDGNGYVSLLASYFSYYGTHRVSIDRIDMAYYTMIQGGSDNPNASTTGNIIQGNGFFIGMENVSFEIEVQ